MGPMVQTKTYQVPGIYFAFFTNNIWSYLLPGIVHRNTVVTYLVTQWFQMKPKFVPGTN